METITKKRYYKMMLQDFNWRYFYLLPVMMLFWISDEKNFIEKWNKS